jgi:arylsulfatase
LEERFHINQWMAAEAASFLTEKRDPSCPVFLHLSFFHPHPPLVPVEHYFNRYLAKDLPDATLGDWSPSFQGQTRAPDSPTGPFDPEIIRRARAAYYALLNQIDDCIASVLEQWTGYGSPDARAPLYILFSSDHGEMLGDHQLFRKSLGYEASARVPFFLTGRNVPVQSTTTDTLVCWEDIAPTLLDLAGVPVPDFMEGMSLAPLLRGEQLEREREYITGECGGLYHNLWIVTKRWKYIWFPATNEEQLFDLQNDPGECHDLSGGNPMLSEMRKILAEEVREDLAYNPAALRPCANQPPQIFWKT